LQFFLTANIIIVEKKTDENRIPWHGWYDARKSHCGGARGALVELSAESEERIRSGRALVDQWVREERRIYGSPPASAP